MADVFKAVMRQADGTSRLCVVKRIRADKQQSVAMAQMMEDEAQITAALRHPGIVKIFEHGTVEDTYILAMEYLDGEDLAAVMETLARQGVDHLPLSVAVFVAHQVAGALGHAHSLTDQHGRHLGLVHRDVSPANIMLGFSGATTILDFGVAKLTEFVRQGRTVAGRIKGKAAYMAPEQVRGAPLDARVDVFALGVVLWEMLTGRRLFASPNVSTTMTNVLEAEIPPPSCFRAEIPDELDEVVLRALERDPAKRFASARALAHALTPFLRARRLERQALAHLLGQLFPEGRPARNQRTKQIESGATLPGDDLVFTELPGLHPDRDHVTVRRRRPASQNTGPQGDAGTSSDVTRIETPPRPRRRGVRTSPAMPAWAPELPAAPALPFPVHAAGSGRRQNGVAGGVLAAALLTGALILASTWPTGGRGGSATVATPSPGSAPSFISIARARRPAPRRTVADPPEPRAADAVAVQIPAKRPRPAHAPDPVRAAHSTVAAVGRSGAGPMDPFAPDVSAPRANRSTLIDPFAPSAR